MLWTLRKRLAEVLINPRSVFQGSPSPASINLAGDRDIERAWITSRMPDGPGKALDFGCGSGALSLSAAMRGFTVTAVDLMRPEWLFVHPLVKFCRGDIMRIDMPDRHFDLILNCSTVEHVGLVGRYGIEADESDGDLKAMKRLGQLLKPGGRILMTIPVGRDTVHQPYCRVYGARRLAQLLAGYIAVEESFWIKNQSNQWIEASRMDALAIRTYAPSASASATYYGVGCFALTTQPAA